jgi:HK97 family phage major capsid protein
MEFAMTEKRMQLPKLRRVMPITIRPMARAEGSDEPNRYEVSFSSEYPVDRWFGTEILEHSEEAIDLSRMQEAGPVLLDHFSPDHVGVIENVRLDADKKLRGEMRFSRSQRGQEVDQDVMDGIRRWISVGYYVDEYLEDVKNQKYTATRWTPVEVSLVAVPADPTVGVGRSPDDLRDVRIIRSIESAAASTADVNTMEATMTQTATTTPAAPAQASAQQTQDNRAAEIVRVCVEHGCPEKAAEYITKQTSVEQVCREILATRREPPVAKPPALQLDISAQRWKEYSLVRALRNAVASAEGQGAFDGLEREVSDEIARQLPSDYKRRGGFFLPLRLRAGLDSKTATAAQELKFTEPGEFIELLRNSSSAVRLGARVLNDLQGPVAFPKQTGSGTAYWVAENPGSDVAESNLTTGTVSLAPKTLQSTTSYSRQLLAQSIIDVEQLVREDLAAIHALAWDRAVFHGSGTANQPTGIYTASGVNAVAVDGLPDFATVVNMITAVFTDNALLGNLGWATTPLMAGLLMQTLIASAAGAPMIWTGRIDDGMLGGYQAIASNQVASNLGVGTDEHGMIFGNWRDVMIGTWGALEIIVDPYRLKKQGMIEVTSFEMVDIAIRHPESFAKATGAVIEEAP